MMYSAYKLNKQGDNIQTWCTPFQFGTSLCSIYGSNSIVLGYFYIHVEKQSMTLSSKF